MIYILVVFIIFLVDFFIKQYVEKKMPLRRDYKIFNGKLIIRKQHNTGIALERLSDKPELVKRITVVSFAMLTIIFIITLFRKGHDFSKIGLAFLVGGAASNVSDRIRRSYVVDYMIVQVKYLRKIVINIGDIFIVLGGVLLLIVQIIQEIKKQNAARK